MQSDPEQLAPPIATPQEFMEMARRAASEIKALRNRIALLEPKADAYDKLAIVLELLPKPSAVYGPDLAQMLERRADQVASSLTKPEQPK